MRSTETSGVEADGVDSRIRNRACAHQRRIELLSPRLSPITSPSRLPALLAATLFVVYDAAQILDAAPPGRHDRGAAGAPTQPLLHDQFVAQTGRRRVHRAEPQRRRRRDRAARRRGLSAWRCCSSPLGFRRRPACRVSSDATAKHRRSARHHPVRRRLLERRGPADRLQRAIPRPAQRRARRLPPGASYPASVRRLIQGGYMQLVREDDDSRMLELHREDGSCLLDRRAAAGRWRLRHAGHRRHRNAGAPTTC